MLFTTTTTTIALLASVAARPSLDFERDVRPILADHCFACHGPDGARREALLRFDRRESVFEPRGERPPAVVPFSPERSLVVRKIESAEETDRMPPASANRPLEPDEIATLRRWVEEGAPYPDHWAFVRPVRPEPPRVDGARGAIDAFLLDRLSREGLAFSPEAPRESLLRRATFDLTGLPPTIEELDAFLADARPDAYEGAVDRLLASPRYGERMAVHWLDLARYADTNGYHIDNHRDMWKWREWVIDAFNRNLPFDQFAVEQLAGDLLPDATLEQRVATGFNRNHPINFEGGADPEEYQTKYVVDRVVTTAEVFMGLTMACAECHDHKYDPISQRDFYSFYAYFNNVPENGLDGQKKNPEPSIAVPTAEESEDVARREREIADAEALLDGPLPEVDAAQPAWEAAALMRLGPAVAWRPIEPAQVFSRNGAVLAIGDGSTIVAGGANPATDVHEMTFSLGPGEIAAFRIEAIPGEGLENGGAARSENGNFVLTEFEADVFSLAAPGAARTVEFAAAAADHFQADGGFRPERAIDGDPATGYGADGHRRPGGREIVFVPSERIALDAETVLRLRLRFESPFSRHSLGNYRISVTGDERFTRAASPVEASTWNVIGPFVAKNGTEAHETAYGPEEEIAAGIDFGRVHEGGIEWREEPKWKDGERHDLAGDFRATYAYRTIRSAEARRVDLSLGSDDRLKVWLNGRLVFEHATPRGAAPDQDRVTVDLEEGDNPLLLKIVNDGGGYAFYFRTVPRLEGDVPRAVESALRSAPAATRTETEAKTLRDHFRRKVSEKGREIVAALEAKKSALAAIVAELPETMVMAERDERRKTNVLVRGSFLDRGAEVEPGVPSFLPPLPPGEDPSSRLTLAHWLVSQNHPLTARVAVNRFWQMLFGRGLVETPEDFGQRAPLPSHPELLDWLAVEFVESGWDVKSLLRAIVTSAAYRQDSSVDPGLLERDPENVLVARGPRARLDAEMIRDAALFSGGLLVERIGGRSVRPYQPAGLWEAVAFGGEFSSQSYVQDEGESLWRRSLYVYWKRGLPYPTLATFDAPIRETCTSRRPVTNTPLQALVMLNDPVFVEAARGLGARLMASGGDDVSRIVLGFRLATSRTPEPDEIDVVRRVLDRERARFRSKPDDARALLSVGAWPAPRDADPVTLAAWTSVAGLLLNLDESIHKG